MSSTSSTNASRLRVDAWMVFTHSRCSVSRRVAASSSDMPASPLSGVRNSWLMLARNRLLAALARRASSVASVSARSRPDKYNGIATSPTNNPTPRLRCSTQYGVTSCTKPKPAAPRPMPRQVADAEAQAVADGPHQQDVDPGHGFAHANHGERDQSVVGEHAEYATDVRNPGRNDDPGDQRTADRKCQGDHAQHIQEPVWRRLPRADDHHADRPAPRRARQNGSAPGHVRCPDGWRSSALASARPGSSPTPSTVDPVAAKTGRR